MIEILKKQWFVVLIALILCSCLVFILWDQNKDKLPGKSEGGKDVVASITDNVFTADDLYTEMGGTMEDAVLYMYFQNAVIEQSIETTDDLKSQAKLQADQILTNAKSQNPTGYKKQLASELTALGFGEDGLEDYMLLSQKNKKLQEEYMDTRLDELFTPVYNAKKSRTVSHILIKMEDSANPTDEEKAKVKSVEDALAAGTDFAEVAKEFSDDGSAGDGGSLGYIDSDSQLVSSFSKAALALDKGEVSEWVKVSSEESGGSYSGWHLIKVDETDKTALEENEDAKDGIYSAISTANSKLSFQAVWEASKKLEVTFADDDTKARLMKYMNVTE